MPGRRKKKYMYWKTKSQSCFWGEIVQLHHRHHNVLLYYNFDSDVLSSEKSSTILHIATKQTDKKPYQVHFIKNKTKKNS